jgi:4'-phosphopantetheinyl transferase
LTDARAAHAELWLIDLEGCAQGLVELECLSRNRFELEQLSTDQKTQRSKQVGHFALRLVLARYMGPAKGQRRFERTPNGQPILSTPPGERAIAFSLSHTPSYALIGCTFETMIGVDLEHPRPITMTSARREIIEHAAAQLNNDPLPQTGEPRTLQTWVRLEALAKADGSGIGRLLTQIGAVGGTKPAAARLAATDMAERLNLRVYDLQLGQNLYGAVALAKHVNVPQVRVMPTTVDAMRAALGIER